MGMWRYFNTEGQCIPRYHYMVNLDDRIDRMRRRYIDCGKYFIINRGRQYGKTTTLRILEEYLKKEYIVIFLDFQRIGTEEYATEESFANAFVKVFMDALSKICISEKKSLCDFWNGFENDSKVKSLRELFAILSKFCKEADSPVILMIDEVDSASNNQVFIDFLAQLRSYYLDRERSPIFHSVVLAGVYDIKNLKRKIRPDQEHQYNSPWNIAAKFTIDMSFSVAQIAGMLEEYERDYHTGMDVEEISSEIYQYTSGYPYLVSAICKYLDEEAPEKRNFGGIDVIWTKRGIAEAVKAMLQENIPLFDSMTKQLDTYKDLRNMVEQILYQGRQILFSPAEKSINLGIMFGFLKEENGHVAVSNRVFEMYLLNLFIAEESVKSAMFLYGQGNKSQFIKGGHLDMYKVLEKFVEYFHDIYNEKDVEFVENYGRKFFLLYLKPIINGTGNYYIEAQTRDARRTDVVVDYLGEQFVIEMKIWHGNEYNERGEKQLAEYLEYFRQKRGYMLSFNFNKKKETGMKVINLDDKMIVEAVV